MGTAVYVGGYRGTLGGGMVDRGLDLHRGSPGMHPGQSRSSQPTLESDDGHVTSPRMASFRLFDVNLSSMSQ
jgi:hypothetical protein